MKPIRVMIVAGFEQFLMSWACAARAIHAVCLVLCGGTVGRMTPSRVLACDSMPDSSLVPCDAPFDTVACQRQKWNHLHPPNKLRILEHSNEPWPIGAFPILCCPGARPIPQWTQPIQIQSASVAFARCCNGVILPHDCSRAKP